MGKVYFSDRLHDLCAGIYGEEAHAEEVSLKREKKCFMKGILHFIIT